MLIDKLMWTRFRIGQNSAPLFTKNTVFQKCGTLLFSKEFAANLQIRPGRSSQSEMRSRRSCF